MSYVTVGGYYYPNKVRIIIFILCKNVHHFQELNSLNEKDKVLLVSVSMATDN